MIKNFFTIIFFLILAPKLFSQEFRATWLARDNMASKIDIAKAMDSLAANNFNVVFVNAWSRGYPLWKSDVFFNETGKYIDPNYEGRDILAEAIAEGHKNGLHVEAWFEYGFVGGWTGNQPVGKKGPIFERHPDWVAKQINGTELDNSNFYWMIHTKPEVQNFLIALCSEISRKYDIDGIELDRIRYSSLNYGYDLFTDSLYKSENNGSAPPVNVADANWIRWRADNLNQFISRCYDSIKSINSKINVSNAPSLYSSSGYTSYYSYCQDWIWWLDNNKVDNVQVQSYLNNPNSFSNVLDYIKTLVNDYTKVFPAFAISPNGVIIDEQTLYQFIDLTRTKGFKGNSIWYYKDIISLLNKFKLNRYNNKSYPPYSEPLWREYKTIIKVSDSINTKKSGTWSLSLLAGYENFSYYAIDSPFAKIDYYINVPISGNYEIYAFQVTATDRTLNAPLTVFDSSDNPLTVKINQSLASNGRWFKICDLPLKKGYSKVATITNEGIAKNSKISADAVMIILNRKLSPVITSVEQEKNTKGKGNFNLNNYPNPFNNGTKIVFSLSKSEAVQLKVLNILGQTIHISVIPNPIVGYNEIVLDSTLLPSGTYLCQIIQNSLTETHKILVIK